MPARSGEELLNSLATRLSAASIPYAATGLSAARALTHHAGFRIVTINVDAPAGDHDLGHLGVREGEQGANVWLVVHNDAGQEERALSTALEGAGGSVPAVQEVTRTRS